MLANVDFFKNKIILSEQLVQMNAKSIVYKIETSDGTYKLRVNGTTNVNYAIKEAVGILKFSDVKGVLIIPELYEYTEQYSVSEWIDGKSLNLLTPEEYDSISRTEVNKFIENIK